MSRESEEGKWKALTEQKIIPSYREGWRGVWDSLVSAVTGSKRHTIPVEYTFSVWVKAPDGSEVILGLTNAKLEKSETGEPKC